MGLHYLHTIHQNLTTSQEVFNTSKFTVFNAFTQHTLMGMNEDGKGAHAYI